nr:sodium channel modifier 1 [Pogona vitticeps]
MSFKREGDDPSLLNVLKKRRVADLLANYIPEDEALLLRDGRYACAVCFHRPVFDTLDMLTVHRSGKKHLVGLQTFYGKKRSLENEVQKRRHQAYVQAEESGVQAAPGPAPLLAYTKRIAQNALLKAAPYNSCCRRNRENGGDLSSGTSKVADVSRGLEAEKPPRSLSTVSSVKSEDGPAGVEATPSRELPGSTDTRADSAEAPGPGKQHSRKGKGPLSGKKQSKSSDLNPEKRQALEHYLRLKSSGWVQDGFGRWVKDENVEFDSDEEEPPAPIPS